MEKKMKIREEIVEALSDSTFPLLTQEELLGPFPCAEDGTVCVVEGHLSVKHEDKELLKPEHFPVATPEQAAELLMKIYGL